MSQPVPQWPGPGLHVDNGNDDNTNNHRTETGHHAYQDHVNKLDAANQLHNGNQGCRETASSSGSHPRHVISAHDCVSNGNHDELVDLVLAVQVFWYFTDRVSVIREMLRWLKPGGTLIIGHTCDDFIFARLGKYRIFIIFIISDINVYINIIMRT